MAGILSIAGSSAHKAFDRYDALFTTLVRAQSPSIIIFVQNADGLAGGDRELVREVGNEGAADRGNIGSRGGKGDSRSTEGGLKRGGHGVHRSRVVVGHGWRRKWHNRGREWLLWNRRETTIVKLLVEHVRLLLRLRESGRSPCHAPVLASAQESLANDKDGQSAYGQDDYNYNTSDSTTGEAAVMLRGCA